MGVVMVQIARMGSLIFAIAIPAFATLFFVLEKKRKTH